MNQLASLVFDKFVFGYAPLSRRWTITQTFAPGDIWSIIGPNGCGKTTVLKAMAGLVPAISGSAVFDGAVLSKLDARRMLPLFFFIPQNPEWIFLGGTFTEHIDWLQRRLGPYYPTKTDGMSFALSTWPDIAALSETRLVDLSSEEAFLMALVEDYLFPRRVLLLDECTSFESTEYTAFARTVIEGRRLRGDITILAGHSDAPIQDLVSGFTNTIYVDELRQ